MWGGNCWLGFAAMAAGETSGEAELTASEATPSFTLESNPTPTGEEKAATNVGGSERLRRAFSPVLCAARLPSAQLRQN